MKALLLGSTGMVGSEVLSECLKDKRITKITVVNRKAINTNKRVREIVHDDFLDFSGIKKRISGFDVCFYCVGIYTGDAPEKQFKEVTYDYLAAFVKTIESPKTIFCLLSAGGANPKSRIMFARWKGRAEEELLRHRFKRIYILRPGYIHPSNPLMGKKKIFYRLTALLYPLFRGFSSLSVTSNQLGKAMVAVSLSDLKSRIFGNKEIRNYLG